MIELIVLILGILDLIWLFWVTTSILDYNKRLEALERKGLKPLIKKIESENEDAQLSESEIDKLIASGYILNVETGKWEKP